MHRKNVLTQSRKKKAATLLQSNKLSEARKLYTRICQADKMDADAWIALATTNRKLGLFKEAGDCCHHVMDNHPNHAAAYHALGSIMECQSRHAEALDCYKMAVAIQPDFTLAHYFLGNTLRECGKIDEAIASYHKAIRLNPDFLEALSNMGAALMSVGKHQEALTALQHADAIRPGCGQVLCNLAELYLLTDNLPEALKYATAAKRSNPNFFDTHSVLGKIHRQAGKYDEALKSYRSALKIQPNDRASIAQMSEILERRGEYDVSYDLLRPYLNEEPLHPGILIAFSELSQHFNSSDKATQKLEASLHEDGVSALTRISVCYALGKLYDDIGKFNQAFKYYQLANREEHILNADIRQKYDPHKLANDVATWAHECPKEFWKRIPCSTSATKRPVFVVGMPRSGTTLAEQILASHPEIYGAGELTGISDIENSLSPTPGSNLAYPQNLETITSDRLDIMAKRYLDQSTELSPGNALRVIDKMPTNFSRLGLISLLFPNAHIIHMVRNPLDTCVSIYFQRFGATISYATDLNYLAEYYRGYQKAMEYWKMVLNIPILDVHYEELVHDQERISKGMVEFCGLTWDDNCLNFHNTKRDVNTPSYHQVRRPMYQKSIGRWKNYEQHLGPLKKVLASSSL